MSKPRSWLATNLGYYGECLESSLESRYFRANVVYLLYTAIIIHINTTMEPAAAEAYTDDEYYAFYQDDYANGDSGYLKETRSINSLYIAAAVIHLINALQYIHMWFPLGYGLVTWVMVPEYLNVIGAAIYLYTSTLYNQCNAYTSPTTLRVHNLEAAAAGIEVLAAFGWCCSWYATYPRGFGRGFTLDDPDTWGNIFIVVPSILYFVYNLQIIAKPEDYGSNRLYETADWLYFVGALVYVASAARDDGFYPDLRIFHLVWRYSGLAWLSGKLSCVSLPILGLRCFGGKGSSGGSSSGGPFGGLGDSRPEVRSFLAGEASY